MTTQRVNCYTSGHGLAVFYIEQYNPGSRHWFTVGDTYEKVEHAQAIADNHNLKQLTGKLLQGRNA